MLVATRKHWRFAVEGHDICPFAQRRPSGWIVEQLGDGRFAKTSFDGRHRIVEPAMERAKTRAVGANPQRTCTNSLKWLHGVDNVPNRQFVRTFGQDETAVQTPSRVDQARSHQSLHQFCQVGTRYFGQLRNALGGAWLSAALGQGNDGTQRVFNGLGNHVVAQQKVKSDLDVPYSGR